MRLGAFELDEPLPKLNGPHALVSLRPWVDVGNVGSLALLRVETMLKARGLAKLAMPGRFFDFTRYRPTLRLVNGKRQVDIPNSRIFSATHPDGNDLVFFHLLEPHMAGEYYAESVAEVLRVLGVERYCLFGSMYDSVPHTKPLLVSGSGSDELLKELQLLGVRRSDYEGPTTIAILASQEASKHSIEVMTLIVHLPQYAQLEEDYSGHLRLMEILCSLYDFPIDLGRTRRKAEKQYERLDQAMKREKPLEQLVQQLEIVYEARGSKGNEELPKLSPEIERFLSEIDRDFHFN